MKQLQYSSNLYEFLAINKGLADEGILQQFWDMFQEQVKELYEVGYLRGFQEGEDLGYDEGYDEGKKQGYDDGYSDGRCEK